MRLNYRVQTDSHSGVSVCLSNEEDFLLNFKTVARHGICAGKESFIHNIFSQAINRCAVFLAAKRIDKPVDPLHCVVLHIGIANAVYAFAFHAL